MIEFGLKTSETSDSIAVHISHCQSSVLSEMDRWTIGSRTLVSESPTNSCGVSPSSINSSIDSSSSSGEVGSMCSDLQSRSMRRTILPSCEISPITTMTSPVSMFLDLDSTLTLCDYDFGDRTEKLCALQKTINQFNRINSQIFLLDMQIQDSHSSLIEYADGNITDLYLLHLKLSVMEGVMASYCQFSNDIAQRVTEQQKQLMEWNDYNQIVDSIDKLLDDSTINVHSQDMEFSKKY